MTDTELSGPWTADMYAEHLPDPIAFDRDLATGVLNLCQPRHSLDLGCGLGHFVAFFRSHGIDAWGVEATAMGQQFKAPGYQLQHDLSTPFDLGQTYDLVLCLEVIEHVAAALEPIVFANIARHTGKYLLFSGGTPGQGGSGHINEKPERYWFEQLAQRGWQLRLPESIALRSLSTLPWYIKNVSLWQLADSAVAQVIPSSAYDALSAAALTRLHGQLFHALRGEQTAQAQLQECQTQLQTAYAEIAAIKSSRTWRLGLKLLRLKKFLPFSV